KPPVSRECVEAMTLALQHRGPDDYGVKVVGSLGLGVRRLSILDTSPQGHQPMSFRDGTVWLAFNGEIYNFPELRAELEERGYNFDTRTDTEVILKCYAEFGKSCFERLWGMFAIGLWDAKINTLFLARDRFGKKPLYYSHHNGRFAFASE